MSKEIKVGAMDALIQMAEKLIQEKEKLDRELVYLRLKEEQNLSASERLLINRQKIIDELHKQLFTLVYAKLQENYAAPQKINDDEIQKILKNPGTNNFRDLLTIARDKNSHFDLNRKALEITQDFYQQNCFQNLINSSNSESQDALNQHLIHDGWLRGFIDQIMNSIKNILSIDTSSKALVDQLKTVGDAINLTKRHDLSSTKEMDDEDEPELTLADEENDELNKDTITAFYRQQTQTIRESYEELSEDEEECSSGMIP